MIDIIILTGYIFSRLNGRSEIRRRVRSLNAPASVSARARNGVLMKKFCTAVAIAIAAVGGAHAADLPTNKEVPPPPPANWFSSLWTYLNSSPADCPLSYAGFTVYATIDAGLGYSSNGAPFNGSYANGVYSFVGKQSDGSKWLWTPNGINQSVVGINMKEPIRGSRAGRCRRPGKRDSTPIPATSSTVHARSCRITARRSSCRAQTATQAAPANSITRLDTSASAIRLSEPSPSAG